MRTCRELTKERLTELGITHVTEDGRIFKGDYEVKQCIASKKGKYKDQAPYATISLIDKTKKIYNPKYGKGWYSYATMGTTAHRAIYAWHYGIVPAGFDVDHIDGNTLNNNLDNLQLLTREENNKKKRYSRNQYTYNLTDEEIEEKRSKSKRSYCRKLHKYVKADWWKEEQNQKKLAKINKAKAYTKWHQLIAERNELRDERKQAKINGDLVKWKELGTLIDELTIKILSIKKGE